MAFHQGQGLWFCVHVSAGRHAGLPPAIPSPIFSAAMCRVMSLLPGQARAAACAWLGASPCAQLIAHTAGPGRHEAWSRATVPGRRAPAAVLEGALSAHAGAVSWPGCTSSSWQCRTPQRGWGGLLQCSAADSASRQGPFPVACYCHWLEVWQACACVFACVWVYQAGCWVVHLP
jgi:hypothetical protein